MTARVQPSRCAWVGNDAQMQAYHDTEWGVPERDGRALWEKLLLDGFQAGLSWRTILHRRDSLRRAFADFVPERVARFAEEDIARLLEDPGIIRSRAKVVAAIGNAQAYLAMQARGEDFGQFVWSAVGGVPQPGAPDAPVPTQTPASAALARALKQRGFAFVGPTIVYAFMQAVGMVNDHAPTCFRRA